MTVEGTEGETIEEALWCFLSRPVRGLRATGALLTHYCCSTFAHRVSVYPRQLRGETTSEQLSFLHCNYCISCLDQALESVLALVFDVQ